MIYFKHLSNQDTTNTINFNIAYQATPPEDTNKLWINTSLASPTIKIKPNFDEQGNETLNSNLGVALPVNLQQAAACSVGTNCYIFGGRSTTYANSGVNHIYKYDTLTNTITKLSATLPNPIYGAAACSVGTNCYIFGGCNNSGYATSSIYKFDTLSNTISTLSVTIPTYPLKYAAACSVGTNCYIFGGASCNKIFKFDTLSNTINILSTTLPYSAGFSEAAACSVGTNCYIFGGYDEYTSSRATNIYKFDTLSNTGSIPKNMTGLYEAAACSVGTNCYIFGGNANGWINYIYKYNTLTNTVGYLSTLPSPQCCLTSCSVGTNCYIFGGNSSNGILKTIYKFISNIVLNENNMLLLTNEAEKQCELITDVLTVGLKNVYIGDSNNKAIFQNAYLHNGTNWINVNTGTAYT